jgi:DNA-binding YbaB/EbfC family protein
MNIQAMMKQAQQLQKKMMDEKKSIDSKVFTGKSSLVSITMTGDKKVTGVDINMDSIESDDKEMLQDMIMLAVNDAITQIDKETEEKMGKYTQGLPGLF